MAHELSHSLDWCTMLVHLSGSPNANTILYSCNCCPDLFANRDCEDAESAHHYTYHRIAIDTYRRSAHWPPGATVRLSLPELHKIETTKARHPQPDIPPKTSARLHAYTPRRLDLMTPTSETRQPTPPQYIHDPTQEPLSPELRAAVIKDIKEDLYFYEYQEFRRNLKAAWFDEGGHQTIKNADDRLDPKYFNRYTNALTAFYWKPSP